MNIFWDGLGARSSASGIGRHITELHQGFVQQGWQPQILFPHGLWETSLLKKWAQLKINHAQITRRQLETHSAGIFHGLANVNLPLAPEKNLRLVLTVHDLIPMLESATKRVSRLVSEIFLPRVLNNADAVITVSEWTKNLLLEKFPEVGSKLVVIPNGRAAQEISGIEMTARESKITRVLYIARLEHYKRLGLFLDILSHSAGRIVGTLVTNQLGADYVSERGRDLVQRGYLKILQSVSDPELEHSMREHDLYVHPSLYEGFGLPILEALRFGKGIICTQGSAAEETQSGVGVFLAPVAKASDWCEAIIAEHHKSLDAAYAQKAQEAWRRWPTWQEVAEKTYRIYQKLL